MNQGKGPYSLSIKRKVFIMNKIKLFIRKYGQFIKFCIVGVVNTTISLVAYYFLLKLGVHYLLASTVSYCVGILNGYIFSTKFVFNSQRNKLQAIKFVGVYLSSLAINLLILYILVDIFSVSEFIAQVIATIFNVVYNYFLNKFWTFKH
jgi:putative flippase GtrA